MGPRVELKQEPVSPIIVIKNPWVILLTSGLFFDITTGSIKAGTRIIINCYKEPVGHFTHIWSVLRHYHGSASNSAVSPVVGLITRAARVRSRCHGLRVYAVCVCNKVRLPGTGQSAHVIVGSRFTRPASNLRRTILN